MRPQNILAIIGILSSGAVDAQSNGESSRFSISHVVCLSTESPPRGVGLVPNPDPPDPAPPPSSSPPPIPRHMYITPATDTATEIADVSPCPVCPSGLTVSGNTVISRPEANGIVCDRLLVLAGGGVSAAVCDEMLLAEEDCCPPVSSTPCDVCASGITVDNTTSVGEGSAKTCGDLAIDRNTVEEGGDECARMKLTELVCCPAAPASPCQVCPGGTPNPGREVSGKTCEELVSDAGLVESSSSVCPQLQLAESACCPPPALNTTVPTSSPSANATALDSCQVCPGGITAPDDERIGDGKTCGGLLDDALSASASSVGCQLMKDAQLTCCPTPAANPCPVCPDGITVDETTAVGSAGKTCADLLVDKMNAEESGDTCAGMFEVAGPVCCPPPATATSGVPTVSPTAAASSAINVTEAPTVVATNATTTAAPSAFAETIPPSSAPVVAAGVVTAVPTVVLDVVEDPSSDPPELQFGAEEPAAPVQAGGGPGRGAGYRALAAAAVCALCAAAYA